MHSVEAWADFTAKGTFGGGASTSSDDIRDSDRGLQTLRLLIVEDEIFIALEIGDVLTEAGHEVVGTSVTAEDAVLKADELRPDLILMDIRLLGERDGVDAAVEIWQRFGIRCLFVSSHTDPATTARAAEAQPIGFVTKPFTQKILLDGIRAFTRPH